MSTIRLSHPAVLKSGRERGFEAARPLTAKVLAGAQTLAPVGSHMHGSGRRVSGPTLKASLHSRQILRSQTEIVFEIGSPLNYAATVHQGSRRHDIDGDPLTFLWPRGRFLNGGNARSATPWFIGEHVNHPGNKRPRRYLTTPLAMYGRQAGFIVSTSPVSRGFLP